MNRNYWQETNRLLRRMAFEEPNWILREIYLSGLQNSEIAELRWLIDVARNAPGYDSAQDQLLINKVA